MISKLPKPDERYVYGATCTWHGPIAEVAKGRLGMPGCPHCGRPLMEVDTKAEFDRLAKEFAEDHGLPHYVAWLGSLREGACKRLAHWKWEADYAEFVRLKERVI